MRRSLRDNLGHLPNHAGDGWTQPPARGIKDAFQRAQMPPTLGNGKICCIEMPATDIARSTRRSKSASASLGERLFGWRPLGQSSFPFEIPARDSDRTSPKPT